MNDPVWEEIQANIERADEALAAATVLLKNGFYDSSASRAYYAAFYVATAALLHKQEPFKSHSGVLGAFHRCYVKAGDVNVQYGKHLSQLSELRGLGDYGSVAHVSEAEARAALEMANDFVKGVTNVLPDDG